MKIKQGMIDKFWKLPEWSKRELFYCDMGWEYTGSNIMGWDYLIRPGASKAKNERQVASVPFYQDVLDPEDTFGFNYKDSYRIPSSVRFYSYRLRDLFNEDGDDLIIDAELDGENIIFKAIVVVNNEEITLEGVGKDSLEAAFDLYYNSVFYYEENYIPSLSSLNGVENTFQDINGIDSIDFKDELSVYNIYKKYQRFCTEIQSIPTAMYEDTTRIMPILPSVKFRTLWFKLRLVEGIVNIYTDYNNNISIDMKTSYHNTVQSMGANITSNTSSLFLTNINIKKGAVKWAKKSK